MPSYTPPKKNTEFIFYVSLVSQASRPQFQPNPTLAAGDVTVSTDGGAFANLTTLPVVTPASGHAVKVTLSAGEMNGDNVYVLFEDQAGDEWDDLSASIQTSARQIDDLSFPTVSGRSEDVTANGAVGVDWGNVENPSTAVDLSATDIQLADTVTSNTDMRGTDNAALALVVGALADAAVDGDPTATDTLVAYIKQLINTLVGTAGIPTYPAAADPANAVSLAEAIRAIRDDVTSIAGSAMRGTDGVDTATMRGTDNAALGSVLGALADAAAAGDPTATDTLMQYIKQLINVLVGTTGVPTFPAEAAPANNVSLAEVIRATHADVTGLNGDTMRGTDSASTHTAAAVAQLVNPQKNTAFSNITFEMYDSTNHNPSTGLTVTGERSLDGGAYAAVTGTIAEISDGTYQMDASAADMNADLIVFRFSAAATDDTFAHVKTAA